MSIGNKYAYHSKYFKPPSQKKKTAPVCVRMSNSTAEVVLQEKKVEIKDLESQVTYLQNQIKTLKVENKTLRDVQTRHEKELKRYKEHPAAIPSLMRSHKDEVKALESNASSLCQQLRECQKELKIRCDAILRKDLQIEKLSGSSKRNEKHAQELNTENKELKMEKKKLDDECKKLLGQNDELKSKSERLQKKIQQMTSKVLELEECLGSTEHQKAQFKDDLNKLQKSYDELQQNFSLPKPRSTSVTAGTQTDDISKGEDLNRLPDTNTKDRCNVGEYNKVYETVGDNLVENEVIEIGTTQDENRISSVESVFRSSGLLTKHQKDIHSHIPEPRYQRSSLLKPIKSRTQFSS